MPQKQWRRKIPWNCFLYPNEVRKERKERQKDWKTSLFYFRLLFYCTVNQHNSPFLLYCTAQRNAAKYTIISLHSNYRARITSIIKLNFLIKQKLFCWLSKFTISNSSSLHLILILCKKYFFKVIESCQKFLIQEKRKMKMAESINYFYLFRINSE